MPDRRTQGILWFAAVLLTGCMPSLTRQLVQTESRFHDHVGFVLYDPALGKTLYRYNGDKFFTPASNVKVLTLCTALQVLGDSVPALRYVQHGDSLIFWGTADPSFLYPRVFQNGRTYAFLAEQKADLYYATANLQTPPLGPGWAWDDYNFSFSAERSSFPVYGNTFTMKRPAGTNILVARNPYFKRFIWLADSVGTTSRLVRRPGSMETEYFPGRSPDSAEWEIPFRTEPQLIAAMLSDTLHRKVRVADVPWTSGTTLYSIPADSLYRVMMQNSDNFIAEHLLMMCAGVLSDTLDPRIAIRYMTSGVLADLPVPPQWVDGSGLSRYNLITPDAEVRVWTKIYERIPWERLVHLLAVGGERGTLKNVFRGEEPYIFGKTGTLSNHHCLSGFVRTQKGKLLIFSYMNEDYTAPTYQINSSMEEFLHAIYEKY